MRNGDRRVWNLETGDLSEAISKAAERLRDIDMEPPDLLRRELDYALNCREKIRDKTRAGQKSVAGLFVNWIGEISTVAVSRKHAAEWLQYLKSQGKSKASLHSYARTMRSLFGCLIREKRLPRFHENPFSRPDLPTLPRSPRRDFCDRKTRDRLIEKAPDEDMRMILFLGFHAGLRKKEIVEARPEWIDFDLSVIHVCKTDTFIPKDSDDRTIPLSKELREFLLSKELPSPFLVQPNVTHGASEYRYDFRAPFEKYMKAQDCEKVTPHTMRRTFASLLVSAGVSIYKVSKWLGDEVDVVTKSYGHLIAYDDDINSPSLVSANPRVSPDRSQRRGRARRNPSLSLSRAKA